MNTAFSVAYPSRRSLMARALLPMVEPRAYLRAIHFLLMFPLGIAYFVFFVTAFAVGGSLIWTFVGPPVLLIALFVSLYIGDLEALLVNLTTREEIKRPPKVLEGVTSLREKVWTRVIDPSTWTGVLYEVAQFPIGVAAFVTVVVGFAVSGALIGAPLIAWLANDPDDVATGPFELSLNDPLQAALLVPLGLLAWFVTIHIVTVLSGLHAAWARLMLGTRSRRIPDGGDESEPDPEPRDPVALLPPAPDAPPAPAALTEEGPPADGAGGLTTHEANPALADLTARECEVLMLVVRGYSNADVCEALYISEGTVKTHIRHILAKLDLMDRTQLIVFAYEQGIVLPGRRPVAVVSSRS